MHQTLWPILFLESCCINKNPWLLYLFLFSRSVVVRCVVVCVAELPNSDLVLLATNHATIISFDQVFGRACVCLCVDVCDYECFFLHGRLNRTSNPINTHNLCKQTHMYDVQIYIHNTCIHTYKHIYKYIYTYIHICIYTYMHTYM